MRREDPRQEGEEYPIQAVGEGNYGRLGAGRQQRYTDANAESMFGEPYAGGTPDEQPGALPEILPSPWDDGPADANIERCWSCRAMFMQAWGNYGTAWPVVHQQLGVRPDLGRRRLEIVPQLPSADPIAGRDIRLAGGAVDVYAARRGRTYTTVVSTHAMALTSLTIGRTLAPGARVARVRLDGRRARWSARLTNRGLEVTVRARPGRHVLQVKVHR